MVEICIVCGYKKDEERLSENLELFSTPKDENLFKKWCKVIEVGTGKMVETTSHVCEKHFKKENIISEIIMRDKYGRVVIHKKYRQKTLRAGSVPSIFNGKIILLSDTIATIVLPPNIKTEAYKNVANKTETKTEDIKGKNVRPRKGKKSVNVPKPEFCDVNNICATNDQEDNRHFILPDKDISGVSFKTEENDANNILGITEDDEQTYDYVGDFIRINGRHPLFEELFNDIYHNRVKLKLPNCSWSMSIQTSPHLILFREAGRITNYRQLPHYTKHVTLHPNLKMELFIKDKFVTSETNLKSFEDVQNAINEIGAI